MPMSESLQPACLRTILDATRTPFAMKRFAPRVAIFHQGDDSDSLMHIETGLVRLAVTTPNGKEAICGVLSQGAFLGEEVLAGDPVRRQTAIAMTAVEALTIECSHAIRLLHSEPAIAEELLAYLLRRHARLEADSARSTPQFQRATPGPHALRAGRLGRATLVRHVAQHVSNGHCRDGRHHPVTRELPPAQVQPARVH